VFTKTTQERPVVVTAAVKRPVFGGWTAFGPSIKQEKSPRTHQVESPSAEEAELVVEFEQEPDRAQEKAEEIATPAACSEVPTSATRFGTSECKYSTRLMPSDIKQMSIENSNTVTVPWDALCPSLQEKLKQVGICPSA
jgi:hypothetical protein